MGTIISYIEEYGQLTFKEMPFNEVDALVLAQFSYLKFEGLVPKITDNTASISMNDMRMKMTEEVVFADERYEKDNRLLFVAMADSNRFGTMKCNCYATIIDDTVETQFCAITCLLKDSLPVIVYRGTDENLVGWKEDFHMAFKKPVPGQNLSVLYLNQVSARIAGEFFVCGHSKGGNLAVYSSMNVYPQAQRRIKRIYSFDGPGFRPEILSSEKYEAIAGRIEKYIPKSSLVGMILESHEDYFVVDSYSIGLLQHDPYTWRVEDASFVAKEEIYKHSRFRNDALNEWILKLDDVQLEIFIETLFHVLEGCDSDNLIDMAVDWKKSVAGMVRAVKDIDEETRSMILEIFRVLFEVFKENVKENLKKR